MICSTAVVIRKSNKKIRDLYKSKSNQTKRGQYIRATQSNQTKANAIHRTPSRQNYAKRQRDHHLPRMGVCESCERGESQSVDSVLQEPQATVDCHRGRRQFRLFQRFGRGQTSADRNSGIHHLLQSPAALLGRRAAQGDPAVRNSGHGWRFRRRAARQHLSLIHI